MPIIEDYRPFGGLHWETSSARNLLTHLGVTAPHTGAPFTADRAAVPLFCTAAEFAAARARLVGLKQKSMTLDPQMQPIDLPAAITAGIHACLAGLLAGPMRNFGL